MRPGLGQALLPSAASLTPRGCFPLLPHPKNRGFPNVQLHRRLGGRDEGPAPLASRVRHVPLCIAPILPTLLPGYSLWGFPPFCSFLPHNMPPFVRQLHGPPHRSPPGISVAPTGTKKPSAHQAPPHPPHSTPRHPSCYLILGVSHYFTHPVTFLQLCTHRSAPW